MNTFFEKFAKLIEVKSIMTITLTVGLIALLFSDHQPSPEILALYCTSYGAITTYFFARQKKDGE